MATILDLFKENKKDIYTPNALTLIETRGLVNIPRLKSLALESPTAIGGLVGATVGALIGGGGAGRPSDTIFRNNKLFSKPITLTAPTTALLQDAVKPGTSYFVKTSPSPAVLGNLNQLKNAVNFKNGGAQSAAISALNKYGSKSGVKGFKDRLKNRVPEIGQYGPEFGMEKSGKVRESDTKYSTHYKNYNGEIQERQNSIPATYQSETSYRTQWDSATNKLVEIYNTIDDRGVVDDKIQKFLDKEQKGINTTYILFKVYGDTDGYRKLLLPSTFSNLSEEFVPSVGSFKYVGSPFSLYRYNGVERVIRFDFKMYYSNATERQSMIHKLNLLREYTFPDRRISTISYANHGGYSPITFNPNILQMTINGLYKDVYCIIESMNFTIEDGVSWASDSIEKLFSVDGAKDDNSAYATTPHPTVINVSISLKVIETPEIGKNETRTGKVFSQFEYEESEKYTNYFVEYKTKN